VIDAELRAGADDDASGGFGRRFRPLFLLGLLGIASLPLTVVPTVRRLAEAPASPELPLAVLVAAALVQPTLLLAISAAVGAWLAPRVGFVSLVAERADTGVSIWPRLAAVAPLAASAGLAVGLVIVAFDRLWRPFLPRTFIDTAAEQAAGNLAPLVTGMLYGGVTEEIMLRWGALTFFAWAGWALFGRGGARPGRGVLWGATLTAALLFGVLHLPAVAMASPLDAALAARTVTLNALGGVVFGWLYWRHHLEAAMIAHAGAHVAFALLAWSGLLA
jgi:hypothetical protein